MLTENQISEIVDKMSLDELCGQVLNFEFTETHTPLERVEEIIKTTHPGSYYIGDQTTDYRDRIIDLHNKYCNLPLMITADVENGPGSGGCIKGETQLPRAMALGASDDPELVEKASRATAQICRKEKISLALSPVVDINYNFANCLVNTRAISDSPDQVIKIGTAVVKGFQKDNLLGACVKHFPGDGRDQRNQHFLTSINDMSREEWMDTYGRVYKAMINAGTMAIMVAHIALPAYDEKIDDVLGYPPATLSYNLMTKLLKNELGFNGCIVSDAMCMIGACAMVKKELLAVEYLKAGGDLVLFALPEDFDHIKNAIESKYLPLDRLKDAVTRILRLKNQVGLFDEEPSVAALIPENDIEDLAQQIADKSICIVRDTDNLLPAKNLKKGSKILVTVVRHNKNNEPEGHTGVEKIKEELENRGMDVTVLVNPIHYDVKNSSEYDYVLFCIDIDSLTYIGGSLRITWVQAMALWRGYLLQNPNVVFISMGDPYKLYDYPFAKTYVNAFSNSKASQRAIVKMVMGEIPALGKSPVRFEGYFERETD